MWVCWNLWENVKNRLPNFKTSENLPASKIWICFHSMNHWIEIWFFVSFTSFWLKTEFLVIFNHACLSVSYSYYWEILWGIDHWAGDKAEEEKSISNGIIISHTILHYCTTVLSYHSVVRQFQRRFHGFLDLSAKSSLVGRWNHNKRWIWVTFFCL